MFRNSFRRSLSQPLSKTIAGTTPSIATTAYPSFGRLEFLGKFVCISCQVRALASQARRGRGTRASGFLGAIKRLEAHVQLIEKRAADLAAQDASRKRLPDLELTEEMQDQAYAALMTPGPKPAAFLPLPKAVSEMLSAPIIERLGSAASLVDTSTPLWSAVIGQLEFNGGFQGMDVGDVNCLLLSMDLKSRVNNTLKLQEMMEKAKLEPDTFTYDLLMMAHAQLKRSEEVKILFENLKKRGVPPTVFTYAHLLKACSHQADVEGAGRAFTEMREANIRPNIVVYTTLIQTCLNRHEIPTAWQIFDLMKLKSRATAPDAHIYSLMLHACAVEGESERALNLFRDMTDRMKLKPTKETYHALIHALAVRKDYYQEVWRYATEMQQKGFKMGRRVLGTLIQACGKRGDLTRARMLVRHMLGSGKEDIVPDSTTYQCLFRAYANAKVKKDDARFAEEESPESSVPYVGPDTILMKQKESFKEDTIPFSKNAILSSTLELVNEARQVMKWLCIVKPHLVDTQLMNAFLDVYCNQGVTGSKRPTATNTEVENPTSESNISVPTITATSDSGEDIDIDPNAPDRPAFKMRVPRNIYTFQIVLNSAYKHRDLSFAWKIRDDRMKYLLTKQYYAQYREPERRRLDIQAECSLINTLARCEMLGEAAKRLEIVSQKYKIYEPDVATLHIKALQLDDAETLRVIKRCVGATPYRHYASGAKFKPPPRDGFEEAEDLSRTW
ncbi:hypothetical protein L873DRAFT_1768811 [Choiromyces venosus 120613-1]|uniref:Pentatricopeptide repeat-containing protein-mitochondrial domain-containing protein n=1 Tax=Choiromyces venosus 120613-1 TaxID=1336337 RepID=A0A3N4JNY0_9PEZI|nr:hypothetical protein L873DRAFT_1768811 [Choiromyces venosus 120613-1]